MNKNTPVYLTLILVGALILSACAPALLENDAGLEQPELTVEDAPPSGQEPATAQAATDKPAPVGWEVEVVAQGLEIPWSVVFPSEERILVSERTGAIREIVDGVLNPEPIYVFEEARSRDEAGLMGLALHPRYESNGWVYACYASTGSGSNLITRVARLADRDDTLTFDQIIIDNIPAARFHAGCRLQFGPDGMLYISTGDATDKNLPQDINSLAGKILRLTPDGDIPVDNPFSSSPVFTLGHRNPQGLTWDSQSGRMFSTEHGPSTFDGPPGGDEINLIVPGGNYGWPLGSHDHVPEGTIAPLIQFTPAEAPASALFYQDTALPFFTDSLFFGALRGEGLVRVTFIENEDGELTVDKVEKIIDNVGRVRDVTAGPDGSIYFTTSNRDGRGTQRDRDDKIYRIIPIFE
jgi:glucose/arabinose dehydrogenase